MSLEEENDIWNFFFADIDGKLHSTMVNLSIKKVVPIETLSVFHCIEVVLIHPNPENGMTTDKESKSLNEMEDFIGENKIKDIKYIAHQTGDDKRKFYFYSSPQADFESFFDAIGKAFPEYVKSTFHFNDVAWETYLEDLYPNPRGMNDITNRDVFDRLEEGGDDLSVPRTIDHSIIFHSKKHTKEFEKLAKEKGFTVQIKTLGFFKRTFDLLVQRVDPPEDLDPITFELQQLAENLGGTYDGWGCERLVANK